MASSQQSHPRAGLLRRLAALLYDAFLVAAIWMLLGYIVQLFFGPESNQVVGDRVETNPVQGAILFSLMLGSCALFYCYFWIRSGQTLGMLAWRLRVEDGQGNNISARQALLRFVLAWPAFLLLGLGYFWLYLDNKGDALHDRWSGSRVVVVPRAHRPF